MSTTMHPKRRSIIASRGHSVTAGGAYHPRPRPTIARNLHLHQHRNMASSIRDTVTTRLWPSLAEYWRSTSACAGVRGSQAADSLLQHLRTLLIGQGLSYPQASLQWD